MSPLDYRCQYNRDANDQRMAAQTLHSANHPVDDLQRILQLLREHGQIVALRVATGKQSLALDHDVDESIAAVHAESLSRSFLSSARVASNSGCGPATRARATAASTIPITS